MFPVNTLIGTKPRKQINNNLQKLRIVNYEQIRTYEKVNNLLNSRK